jgi:hypothetical protein
MLSKQSIHAQIHFVSLLGVAVGLPLNKIVLSISGLLMALNWIIEANFVENLKQLKSQKTGLMLTALFLVLSLSLLYSENTQYGLNDLRIKLPLLLFPVVILSSKALSFKKYSAVLHAFMATVILVTTINFINYQVGIYQHDSREMSLFGSHIRLSLMVTFSFFFALYAAWTKRNWWSVLYYACAIWLLFYAYKSEVLTGYFGLVITAVALIFWGLIHQFKKHKKTAFIAASLLAFLVCFIFYRAVYPIPQEARSKENLSEKTSLGGTYQHDTSSIILENGYYIHYFICHEELDSMLQLKTGKSIALLNQEHQDFFPTLIRYMSSLGLRKDAEGFAQLTDADLNNIFNGIPSVVYAEGGVKSRLARITMELQKHLEGADPNGSTIQQRIEYWRTGWDLIKKYPIFGVGVGDVQDAFNQQYALNQTRLFEENRLHSHQQFVTIWISVGIIGLFIFLMNILLTIQIAFRLQSILLYLFVIIITFSYFFEDTLETQVGVSLAAFFLSFLLKQEQEKSFFEEKNKASL